MIGFSHEKEKQEVTLSLYYSGITPDRRSVNQFTFVKALNCIDLVPRFSIGCLFSLRSG